MQIIVHRGTHQIGGCCTEIATANTRILVDFGMPLPESRQESLELVGVTSGKARCDGILITHYHSDHIGEINNVLPNVPIYIGESTKEIVAAYKQHMREHFYVDMSLNNVRPIQGGVPFTIGDMKITPIISDHSSFQSYMFLIEAEGKRVLHTGDFRLHGPYRDAIMKQLEDIRGVDLVITEGTTLNRSGEIWTEERVKSVFSQLMNRYKYCFLLTSSSNLDRISQFAQAIERGRYFLVDEFQNRLLEIVKKYDIDSQMYMKKAVTYGNNIKQRFEKRGFGMVVRVTPGFEKIIRYYMTNHGEETCLIYSMWTGYKEANNIKKFLEVVGEKVYVVHSSGHVALQDLNLMLNMLDPKRILFIHTENHPDDISIDIRERIVELEDGRELKI